MIALDDAGWLWTFQYDGTSSIGINLIPTDLKLSFPLLSELSVRLHGSGR